MSTNFDTSEPLHARLRNAAFVIQILNDKPQTEENKAEIRKQLEKLYAIANDLVKLEEEK